MIAVRIAFALLGLVSLGNAAAPFYTLASVVNSATGVSGEFAPNGMVTIYGTNLAYGTESAPAGQSVLPRILAGVSVVIGGVTANLYYVSPQQVNFLVPSILIPGPTTMFLAREGAAGPVLNLVLKETAPGFFVMDGGVVIATHADGKLLSDDSPAVPEEVVVIYAAGLGRTNPDVEPGRPVVRATSILLLKQLALTLGGTPIDSSRVLYAGATPGFAGLYQINLRIPADAKDNPEIRAFIGVNGSPSYLKLPVRVQ